MIMTIPPIFLIKKKAKLTKDYVTIRGRCYRAVHMESFCSDIDNINWEVVFLEPDRNIIWSKMQSHFVRVINKHCPEKEFRTYAERLPYLSDELISLMKDRDEAFKKARKRSDEDSWVVARGLRRKVQS